jgi:hypothetical protein
VTTTPSRSGAGMTTATSTCNLPSMRRMLSDELASDLEEWSRRWATVDGGEADGGDALAGDLIAGARILAARVADELGPDYAVSVRWDAPR